MKALSKTDTLFENIYLEIITGDLIAGKKIHIKELSSKYSVGLSPIREALSRLVGTGFVNAHSQKGFSVSSISIDDLNDLYNTRIEIEKIALGQAIQNGNTYWEAEMLSSFHLLEQFERNFNSLTHENYQSWERNHRAFNSALIAPCNSFYLIKIQKNLYQLCERYRYIWLKQRLMKGEFTSNCVEQKRIMEAAIARDSPKAISLLEKYYIKAKKLIAQSLQ